MGLVVPELDEHTAARLAELGVAALSPLDLGATAQPGLAGDVLRIVADSPVVAYYVGKDPSSFSFAKNPEVVNPIPIGIAIRKGDTELQNAVTQAIKAIYADDTMKHIIAKWKLPAFPVKT